MVVGSTTYVESEVGTDLSIPLRFELAQNFPNPFDPITTIRFGLPEKSPVSLVVYSVTGREIVRLLADTERRAGYHTVVWDGRDNSGLRVATGVYLYELTSKSDRASRTMVVW